MSAAISQPQAVPSPARPEIKRARWWAQVLLIAWLAWIYDLTTDLAPVRRAAALSHGAGLLSFERTLHLDPELTLNRWLAGHSTFALITSDWYDNAHFVITFGVIGWLWWRRPDLYRPLRNVLVAINLIAFAVFLLYPVAPPRLLPGAGFSDLVAITHAFGGWHTGALAHDANQYAAMPSLHIGWSLWSALAIWRMFPTARWRWLAGLHPLFTAFAVMATGNHFLMDVLAGVAITLLAVLLERERPRLWRAVRGSPAAADLASR